MTSDGFTKTNFTSPLSTPLQSVKPSEQGLDGSRAFSGRLALQNSGEEAAAQHRRKRRPRQTPPSDDMIEPPNPDRSSLGFSFCSNWIVARPCKMPLCLEKHSLHRLINPSTLSNIQGWVSADQILRRFVDLDFTVQPIIAMIF